MVHRIQLEEIKVKLETVETEKMSISYSLIFYVSQGPLEFQKAVGEVFLSFLSYPGNIEMAHEQKRQKLGEVEKRIEKTSNGFMLPHANIAIDPSRF